MRLVDVGEFGLIDRIAALVNATQSAPSPERGQVVLGIGDDASVVEIPADRSLVSTVDTLVEEVHFRRDWTTPQDLGWKSLAVNVSDIAAMGAEPLAAFLSLALPPETEVAWVEAFTRGLADCARKYGCAIAGGDTVRSPQHVAITVTLLGTVERGRALLRSGARVGDAICVTGTLGDAAAGFALLQNRNERPSPRGQRARTLHALLAAHHRPRPRLEAARMLAASGQVTAMMDLSDGLASDLRHLAARSGVGARVCRDSLPLSDAVRSVAQLGGVDPTDWALHGGEDYELLFTAVPQSADLLRVQLHALGVPLTVVGEVVEEGVWLVEPDASQAPLTPDGFAHFRAGASASAENTGGCRADR
jgi:thiamine-monophosphate kinase